MVHNMFLLFFYTLTLICITHTGRLNRNALQFYICTHRNRERRAHIFSIHQQCSVKAGCVNADHLSGKAAARLVSVVRVFFPAAVIIASCLVC